MDPLVVQVEAERFGFAVPQRQGGGGFGGVGEPQQLGESDGAGGGLDVAKGAAGADRGELLVVSNQPYTAPAVDDVADGCVEGKGVGHARLVDDHQGRRPNARSPVGRCPWPRDQLNLANVSVGQLICSPRTAAAAAEGARPRTVPPPAVHATASARIAVVFPAPAGAKPSCSRAADVAISRTSAACPAFRAIPLAVASSNATSTAVDGMGFPS